MNINKPYISIRSKREIEREIHNADFVMEKEGSGYPDSTYEEGVQATLRWVMGQLPPPTSDALENIESREQA